MWDPRSKLEAGEAKREIPYMFITMGPIKDPSCFVLYEIKASDLLSKAAPWRVCCNSIICMLLSNAEIQQFAKCHPNEFMARSESDALWDKSSSSIKNRWNNNSTNHC